jgi:septum site-determining protein MinC
VALLRGRRQGLEIGLAGRELGDAFEELEARLAERPGFYRGTSAVASFGPTPATPADLIRLRGLLEAAGIELRAISGAPELEAAAVAEGLAFEVAVPERLPEGELDRRRALRSPRELPLSENARSLIADFAGARADIAGRRKRGEASVRRIERAAASSVPVALHAAAAPSGTLYHAGTLRGGQALHQEGTIVVVGDVNPGAELVATGDIVVFGRLAGVAHAGAQGDAGARVYALDLAPTQLRIATFIAAEPQKVARQHRSARAEAALVRDGRIAVVAFDRLDSRELGDSSP